MNYIIDEPPNYCPQCGDEIKKNWEDPLNRNDFHAHASHTCQCGAHFQKVTTFHILEAADIEGDMKQNANR